MPRIKPGAKRQLANREIRDLINNYLKKRKASQKKLDSCAKWIDRHLQRLAHRIQTEKTMIGHMERKAIKASMRVYVAKYLQKKYGRE